MKKALILILALILLIQINYVLADHDNICDELETGEDFGQHITEHAQEQLLSQDDNPGTHHQGYSICVP